MARGEKASPKYVNPYEPASLVSFVARTAILSEYPSYSDMLKISAEWKSVGGLSSSLDAPTRNRIRLIETLVNRRSQQWYLTAFYDAVVDPEPADIVEINHTEGELPSQYLTELANAGPARSKPEVNVRGMAMRSYLLSVDPSKRSAASSEGIAPLEFLNGGTVMEALEETANDLAIVACAPPTSGGGTATRLLAEAGTLAIDVVRQHVMQESPVAWRLVRVVTELLKKAPTFQPHDPMRDPEKVILGCEELLREIHEVNPACIYRARSLWEEAAGLMPKRAQFSWLNDALEKRAAEGMTDAGTEDTKKNKHSELPVRERMTAAWVFFWRMARFEGWRPGVKQEFSLKDLSPGARDRLHLFADRLEGAEEYPDDKAGKPRDTGLTYASRFIKQILDDGVVWYPHAANEELSKHRTSQKTGWWMSGNREAEIVRSALANSKREIDRHKLDYFIHPSLEALILHSCLAIDGISRRESLAAIQYANLHSPASEIFARVIQEARLASSDPNEFRWLIESATFSLGWMMHPESTLGILLDLCTDKLDNSIRLTALMAIGDMAEKIRHDQRKTDRTRAKVGELLSGVLAECGGEFPRPDQKLILRAATYVLAMLRHSDDASLLKLVANPVLFAEDTTPALAQWGLDRIYLRQEVSAHWARATPSSRKFENAELHAHLPSTLRRLVDPLESLKTVKKARKDAPETRK
jgi:hypothetical protein